MLRSIVVVIAAVLCLVISQTACTRPGLDNTLANLNEKTVADGPAATLGSGRSLKQAQGTPLYVGHFGQCGKGSRQPGDRECCAPVYKCAWSNGNKNWRICLLPEECSWQSWTCPNGTLYDNCAL